MNSLPPRRSWTAILPRCIAALLALAIVGGAAPIASAKAHDAHSQDCMCGPRCREGACCCGPKAPKPRSEPSQPPSESESETDVEADVDVAPEPLASGPCFGVDPRGDAAAPTKAAPRTSTESGLAATLDAREADGGRIIPPPHSDRPPSAGPDRLDRPPRMDAFA